MIKNIERIGGWLNQNYIIRLFGILYQGGIISAGKKVSNPYTEILAKLRHKVGAHSAGYRNPGKSDSKKITKLINKHLDNSFIPNNADFFNLSIDTVIEPLKNQCVQFIRTLEGKVKN